eukprot:CAMPEP_0175839960 /NCGR_PEP_ID=MMETSP0107_2-20121207/19099_1 /TAXON_ID=195067 ORGANISM="Goniomonas pacifica, Strain CCMP1869" /NCGR_SAMPLE_ID=MMETSP0107_2 /ASSEMBLY_ACC=CAM_ASM_000203 /LENGTH=163 /DNA_ID=CAMNT_0017153745 /DNA_START=5 /DNA_END=496 /DNA_ORIENTATION=+
MATPVVKEEHRPASKKVFLWAGLVFLAALIAVAFTAGTSGDSDALSHNDISVQLMQTRIQILAAKAKKTSVKATKVAAKPKSAAKATKATKSAAKTKKAAKTTPKGAIKPKKKTSKATAKPPSKVAGKRQRKTIAQVKNFASNLGASGLFTCLALALSAVLLF